MDTEAIEARVARIVVIGLNPELNHLMQPR